PGRRGRCVDPSRSSGPGPRRAGHRGLGRGRRGEPNHLVLQPFRRQPQLPIGGPEARRAADRPDLAAPSGGQFGLSILPAGPIVERLFEAEDHEAGWQAMRHWSRRGILPGLLLSMIMIVQAVGAPPARADEPATGIASVTVTEESIIVAGAAPAGATVDVFALGAERSARIDEAEPAGSVTAADGAFSAELPRTAADGTDRIHAQFVAAVDGEPLGPSHFADRFDFAPANPDPL